MVICLERGADLHTAQLMPLPLTVSCSSEIQIGFAFLVPAHLGSHGQRAVKRLKPVCVWGGGVYVICLQIAIVRDNSNKRRFYAILPLCIMFVDDNTTAFPPSENTEINK